LIPANDILGRRNEIKDCIAADNMDEAMRRLIDFIRDFFESMEDEVLLLSRDYHAVLKMERMRLEPIEQIERLKGHIANRVLATLKAALHQIEHS